MAPFLLASISNGRGAENGIGRGGGEMFPKSTAAILSQPSDTFIELLFYFAK